MKFFILGDRKMLYLNPKLINDPDFGGFLSDCSKYLDFERRGLDEYSNETISFNNFLRYSKKNGAELVLYYNDIVGAINFKNFLLTLSREFNFTIKNFIEFTYERNIPLIYEPMRNYIEKTIEKKDEWIGLSKKMSDKFSKDSILAFLKAIEKKTMEDFIPFVIPFEFEGFNKYSNHFSFTPNDNEVYVDIGAYDGDSIAKFIESTPTGKYKKIYAFEPNKISYSKLCLIKNWIPNLETFNLAASNQNATLKFNPAGGSMAARLHQNNDIINEDNLINISAIKLDDVLNDVTFIKIDVEGFEVDVIEGASKLIKNCKPTMVIDTYHYANDAIKIYEKVLSIHDYKFVGMRFAHANTHSHSLYFSDTKTLT
jgi:FkbM family methyltransferase